MEEKPKKRVKNPWWEELRILLFGYCFVCREKEAAFMASCRRDADGMVMLCPDCCTASSFANVKRIEEGNPLIMEEIF